MFPAVKLFGEKVARLEDSRLYGLMKQGWRWHYDFAEDRPGDKARMPDLDSIEAYVLNLRFFIQDNEPCSISRIAKLYDSDDVDPRSRRTFRQIREALNQELEKVVWFRHDDKKITYRQVFLGFIYGQLAHSNVKKYSVVDDMVQSGFGYMLTIDLFLRCIDFVHRCLVAIRDLNQEVFDDA